SAKHEASQKKFQKSDLLFNELNRQTIDKVKRSGLPYFVFTEKEQTGADFGHRFANAIQAVYDKGYDNIITVGNDTPHLKTSQIKLAAEKLKTAPVVLGPSVDGGFYLMGLRKSHFNAEAFISLPWKTRRLTQYISEIAGAQNIEIIKLKVLADIDSSSDIFTVLKSRKSLNLRLISLLLSLIFNPKSRFFTTFEQIFDTQFPIPFNKGSPQLLR
ncbi:MAG: DUF2064 domain-containing protein, partial [Leeuwenhoekiella sp.]